MDTATQIRTGPIYKATRPERNARYRQWIKRFACAACESTRLVDPAHSGNHGLGSKSSEFSCVPFCMACHDLFDADPRGFAVRNNLDVAGLILKFNGLWEERLRRTA